MAKSTWQPPRGIRYKYQPGRPKPFVLVWRHDGVEHSRAFADEKERERWARDLAQYRARLGEAVLSFDPVEWLRIVEFRKVVGKDTDLMVIANAWLAGQQGTPQVSGLLVHEAVARYFQLRDQERNWGADAKRHARTQLERFVCRFGQLRLHEVAREQVRAWLFGVAGPDGRVDGALLDAKSRPIGEHGIKDHLKNVRTFFGYALREKWGAIENPCDHIKPPTPDDGDPVVIPLRSAFDFFKINAQSPVVGRVALEAFAGIRYSTAGAIDKDSIDFDRCGIRMAPRIHKSGKRDNRTRYRQGHPENVWEWLRHVGESCWEMTPLDYREAKRNAAIAAGIRPLTNSSAEDNDQIRSLRNIWRHSFISYHLARHKNPPLTQYLAQHSNLRMTEDYEGLATDTDAARYFMISPRTVQLSWDEFLQLPIASTKMEQSRAEFVSR